MATKGGQPGNNNATKNKPWREAIDKAIKQDKGKRLRQAAEAMLTAASEGKEWAISELGDRLDGRASQQVELGNKDGAPLVINFQSADDAL